MEEAVAALRAFNRFYTRFAGALDAHYLDSDLSLAEARLLYEIANRDGAARRRAAGRARASTPAMSAASCAASRPGAGSSRGRGEDARRRPISLTAEGRARFDALDARDPAPRSPARIEALARGDRDTLVAALETVTGAARRRRGALADPHLPRRRPRHDRRRASRSSTKPYGWGRPMEILQGEVTTAFLRDFKPGREQCWVAERAGLMAGAVLLVDAGDNVGQLRLLHVEPWARGLGIGRALVAECVALRPRRRLRADPPVDPHRARQRPPHLRGRRLPRSSRPRSTTNSASPSRARPGSLR